MDSWLMVKVFCSLILIAIHSWSDWHLLFRPVCWKPTVMSILRNDLSSHTMIRTGLPLLIPYLCAWSFTNDAASARYFFCFLIYGCGVLIQLCHVWGSPTWRRMSINAGFMVVSSTLLIHVWIMNAHTFFTVSTGRFVARLVISVVVGEHRLVAVSEAAHVICNTYRRDELEREIFALQDFSLMSCITTEVAHSSCIFMCCLAFQSWKNAQRGAKDLTSEAQVARRLMSVLSDAVVQLNSDLKIVESCRRLPHILGAADYSESESHFEGIEFSTLLEPSDRPHFEDFIAIPAADQDIADRTQARSIHIRMLCGKGLHHNVRLVHMPVPKVHGVSSHILGISLDDPGSRAPQMHALQMPNFLGLYTKQDVSSKDKQSETSSEMSSANVSTLSSWEPLLNVDHITIAIDPFVSPRMQMLSAVCEFHEAARGPYLLQCVRSAQRAWFSEWLRREVNDAGVLDTGAAATGRQILNGVQFRFGAFKFAAREAKLNVVAGDSEVCYEVIFSGIEHKPSSKLGKQSSGMPPIPEQTMRHQKDH